MDKEYKKQWYLKNKERLSKESKEEYRAKKMVKKISYKNNSEECEFIKTHIYLIYEILGKKKK